MDKKELRKFIRTKNLNLSDDYKKNASESICNIFLASTDYHTSENIFIYVSLPNEPDTSAIIRKALEDKKNVFVPKCISKGHMIAVRVTDDTEYSSGYMNICEPRVYQEENDTKIDIAIVPCISADTDGKRLGHGGGFYDIFLKKHSSKNICLCFNEILCTDIPMNENDIYMDAVITERGFFNN